MQGFNHNQSNWDHLSIDWTADFSETSGNTPSHRDDLLRESATLSNEDNGENVTNDKKKISDAKVYGPRFCTIFDTYTKTFDLNIDITRHLMSLCVENLIPFVKWARETVPTWVATTLLENDYLRPEVRNGIVIVIIYTFASIKATVDESLDMFITLQDNETGLGIANKFSLKIYNDPFNYLSFLKTSISALIDAGAIPENAKLNQPKRNKTQQFQNREEITAYTKIQKQLVEYLDAGNNTAARNMVMHITCFWQQRGKFVRNRRFSSALAALSQPLSSFAPPAYDDQHQQTNNNTVTANKTIRLNVADNDGDEDSSNEDIGMMDVVNRSASASSSNNKRSLPAASFPPPPPTANNFLMAPSAKRQNTGTSSLESGLSSAGGQPQQQQTQTQPSQAGVEAQPPTTAPPPPPPPPHIAAAAANSSGLSTFSLPALRFERISWQEWEVKETRIYDLPSFITAIRRSKHESAICLLDENVIITELQYMKLDRKCHNAGGLEQELLLRKALITSWPVSEMAQFQSFVSTYAQHIGSSSGSSSGSLIAFWRRQSQQQQQSFNKASSSSSSSSSESVRSSFIHSHHSPASSSLPSSSPIPVGYIAYEVAVTVIIILRRNDSLHITADTWCTLYPTELTAVDINQTFGNFLTSLFPQLLSLEKNVMHGATATGGRGEAGESRFPLQGKEITIKYYPHKRDITADMISSTSSTLHEAEHSSLEGDVNVPKQPPLSGYQTIGTYAAPAAKVIARLNAGPLLHDFMLEHHS